MIRAIRKLLPYTYEKIIRGLLDKGAFTILDFGCGDGTLIKFLNSGNKYQVTGVDAFKPFLKKAKETGAYNKLIEKDIRKINFAEKSFDIVLSSQVLEYLTKKEGMQFLKRCEKIAKKQVIIAAYIGNCYHIDAQGNPYQTSNSEWYPKDLMKLGYKIYGQGYSRIYKEKGYVPRKLTFFDVLPIVLSYLMAPLVYKNPILATHMICVKKILND